jgi:lambda family phage tail tape measure protein
MEIQLFKDLQAGGDPKELYRQYEKTLQDANDAIDRRNQDQKSYNADPMNGVHKAIDAYYQSVQDQSKAAETLVTGGLSRMEDAFVQFAKTGKLSMGDLFSYIEDQFLRMEINKLLLSMVGSDGGSWGGALFTAISGSSGNWGSYDGSHANGLGYVPFNGYMAQLHEGERVLTKQENQAFTQRSASGTTVHVGRGQVINIGQGVSRAEVVAGIQQANAQLLQQIRRLNRQERLQ